MKLAAIILAALSGSACATTVQQDSQLVVLSGKISKVQPIKTIDPATTMTDAYGKSLTLDNHVSTLQISADQSVDFLGRCEGLSQAHHFLAKVNVTLAPLSAGFDNTKTNNPVFALQSCEIVDKAFREYSGFIANSYLVGMGSIDTIISDHLATELVYDVDKDPILFLGKCGDKAERVTISVKKTDRNIYELLECRKADTIGT